MPRQDASDFAIPVNPSPERVRPPAHLSEAERAEFLTLVNSATASRFKAEDVALLSMHVRHSVAEREAFELYRERPIIDGKLSHWLGASKMHAAIVLLTSRRLNLHPAGRRAAPTPSAQTSLLSAYDEIRDAEDRDDYQ
ncbi:hypothetical protein I6F20_17055 [Bradyrhizobium sp. IC3123]|uniref:hypothetical protein n=1 Tax=Bradyrhizobium sp. IC3123 TaxID=2793803 RepID=UPI001CD6B5C6|nr:hypothetical protein [Bradyrhizobium sp. IC3123]MCA1390777.1 hypothetical protein [Bradyrhizobium sp. IC3123]